MNLKSLQPLRIPIVVLLATIAAGGALEYHTRAGLDRARQQLAQQEAALRDARTRLQRSGDEKAVIERYVRPFEALAAAGFIGEEKRIDWIEGLRLANQRTGLFGVEYQISPRSAFPYGGEFDTGQLNLQQSVMRVNFRMLHEGDLMRFLAALAQQNLGLFQVNQCLIERTGGESLRMQAQLRADCDLAWLTIRLDAPAPVSQAAR